MSAATPQPFAGSEPEAPRDTGVDLATLERRMDMMEMTMQMMMDREGMRPPAAR